MKKIDLTGQVFDRLTVVGRGCVRVSPGGSRKVVWQCKCSCGNDVLANTYDLTHGKVKSCGCRKYDINKESSLVKPGQVYGRQTVVERDETHCGERAKWICKCECGKEKAVLSKLLQNGRTRSCGCLSVDLNVERCQIDLTGKRFGRLSVLKKNGYITTKSGYKHAVWSCLCDCGEVCDVFGSSLLSGNTKSCGCMKCSYSEWLLHETLNREGLCHEREYSFPDLLSDKGNPLRFDFAFLHDDKLICLLEYQGQQHYSGGKFGEYQRQVSDAKKRKYCEERGIPQYEIKYDDDIEDAVQNLKKKIHTLYVNSVPRPEP